MKTSTIFLFQTGIKKLRTSYFLLQLKQPGPVYVFHTHTSVISDQLSHFCFWLSAKLCHYFDLIRKFLHCLHYLAWNLKCFGLFPAYNFFQVEQIFKGSPFSFWCMNLNKVTFCLIVLFFEVLLSNPANQIHNQASYGHHLMFFLSAFPLIMIDLT